MIDPKEEEVMRRIRDKDARLKMTQESYRARDMVVDDVIHDLLFNALYGDEDGMQEEER